MLVFAVKNIRLSKNISLYKLSQMTDISRTYLRRIENNKECNPTIYVLSEISKALNVNIKNLFYSELDIDSLKEEMYRRIDLFGIKSKEVLEISQIIDLLINIDFKKD